MISEIIEIFFELNEHWEKEYQLKTRSEDVKIVKNKITFVLGVRRVGKSSLLKLKINELLKKTNKYKILYFNFFNPLLSEYLEAKKLYELIKEYLKLRNFNFRDLFIFFDEIQEVREWHKLVDLLREKGAKVIVSGSNSKILKGEVAYLLTGRTIKKEIFPLSFVDFINWKEEKISDKFELFHKSRNLIKEYIISSMPEYVLTQSKLVIEETYNDIIMKDIFLREEIRDKNKFREIVFYLTNEVANYFTFSSLSKKLNLDVRTISKYLLYLNESYLFYFLNTYSTKTHEQINSPKKIYIVDNGFYNVIKTKTTKDLGKLMENTVFINLRRKYKENEELFYYKTKDRYEVDFLIKEKNQIKELINVTYANSYEEINEREIRALLHAKKELNLSKNISLTIITWDYEDEKEVKWFGMKGKIRFVPLWKWLLKN
jgi:predicted AAA+ superfamily ATPase